MKTFTFIFALSLISSIAMAQASKVGKLKGGAGSGAAAASYAATGKAVAIADTTKTAPGNSTAGKQTQGATFGEKVSQGLHAAGSAVANGAAKTKVANPGNPIGGIIVKSGKN